MSVPVGSSTSSSGLGTGIDVNSYVTTALAFDQANITTAQQTKSSFDLQSKALSQLSSELNSLQDAAYALSDPLGALNAQTATSSDTSVLTATATSSASSSTHTITVNSLATTSSYYTDAVASSSTAINTGTFNVQVGTNAPVAITVDSTNNTLSGLASAINSQGIGVLASVIQDANGARLGLVSQSSGASGDLTVSGNTTNLNFNKAVTGANASLTVDGVPISSASNSVGNVINGVTLNLTSASPNAAVSLTVNPDTTQATSAINRFVSAYNTAISDINGQFNVASDGSGGGPLEADGSVRQAQSLLLGAISYSVAGNNGIVNLASIGVNLNNDGTLSVDNAKFQTALSGNNAAVQNFLQATNTGFANNLSNVLNQVNDPASGVLGVDAKGLTATSQDLGQRILDLQDAFATRQQYLVQVYSKVNVTLQELPLLQSQVQQQLASA